MSKGKLFEYAVLYHPRPTKAQHERGETPKSEVVIAPTTVLATSPEIAGTIAAREIPAEYVDKLEDVEVLVRPF